MESPRFNEAICIKYIVINSSYNNRLLSNKKYASILHSCIVDLSEHIEDICEPGEGFQRSDDVEFKDDVINIIPDYDFARLLFTKHSGYTWIEADEAQGKIYANEHSDTEIKDCLEILDDRYVSGSFVIELSDHFDIDFRYILSRFIRDLTKAKYCGFFDMSQIEAMYDSEKGVLYLVFDTESG
jgi:hypothetical protein